MAAVAQEKWGEMPPCYDNRWEWTGKEGLKFNSTAPTNAAHRCPSGLARGGLLRGHGKRYSGAGVVSIASRLRV